MIHSLKLQNFQSHKDSTLEFSKGVNVIAGQSDSGKTAILRALRWLITNRPQGDAFRSHWGGDTEVSVTFHDGTVTRGRHKKSDNFYSWDKDDKEFKAFGTSVPDPITDFLNVEPVNVQGQLDPPFLLSATPGEVAKYLNSIANLDKIDSASYYINAKYTTIDSSIKMHTELHDDMVEELKRFEGFDELDVKVKEVEELDKKYKQNHEDTRILNDLIVEYEGIENELIDVEKYANLSDVIESAVKISSDIETLSGNIKTITTWESTIHGANSYVELEDMVNSCLTKSKERDEILAIRKEISTLDKSLIRSGEVITLEKNVEDALAYGDAFVGKKNELAAFNQAITQAEKITNDVLDVVDTIYKDEQLLRDNMPEICPLCEQRTDLMDQLQDLPFEIEEYLDAD